MQFNYSQQLGLDFDNLLVELLCLFDQAEGLERVGVEPLFQDGVRNATLGRREI